MSRRARQAGGRRETAAAALVVSLLALALGLGGPQPAGGAGAAGDKRPNVVVVMTDDQRVDDLEVMAGVQRRLIDRGATFERFYATHPLCCPSRVTYLTGQYSHNHGVLGNAPPDGGFAAFTNDAATLPVALRGAGYRTGFVGKYLNGYGAATRSASYVPPGWTEWYGSLKNRLFDFAMNENGERVAYHGPRNYGTDVEARKAVSFIRRSSARAQPFFLTLAARAVHTETGTDDRLNPRPAPRHRGAFRDVELPDSPAINEADVSDKPSFVPDEPLTEERLERVRLQHRSRLESLLAVDDAVRRVVRRLREEGELANTWIFFTSDNGYLLSEHRLVAKTRFYEESARVPLIVRGPGVPEGVTRRQLAGNVDLAPTILELAEAAPAPGMAIDGSSLVPEIANPAVDAGADLLLELRHAAAVREGDWIYAEHDTDLEQERPDEFELYDLADDPFQLENVYEDSLHGGPLATRRQALEQRLDQIRDCAGASCP